MCEASNYGIGAALLYKNQYRKMKLISWKTRLFSFTELQLSTIFREFSATIYALSQYEFLIQGSQHPFVLYTGRKPIFFLFTH